MAYSVYIADEDASALSLLDPKSRVLVFNLFSFLFFCYFGLLPWALKYCFEYTFSSCFKDKFIHNELNWAENEYTCIMTIFVGRRSTRLTILQQGSKKLGKKRDVFWLLLNTYIHIYYGQYTFNHQHTICMLAYI